MESTPKKGSPVCSWVAGCNWEQGSSTPRYHGKPISFELGVGKVIQGRLATDMASCFLFVFVLFCQYIYIYI